MTCFSMMAVCGHEETPQHSAASSVPGKKSILLHIVALAVAMAAGLINANVDSIADGATVASEMQDGISKYRCSHVQQGTAFPAERWPLLSQEEKTFSIRIKGKLSGTISLNGDVESKHTLYQLFDFLVHAKTLDKESGCPSLVLYFERIWGVDIASPGVRPIMLGDPMEHLFGQMEPPRHIGAKRISTARGLELLGDNAHLFRDLPELHGIQWEVSSLSGKTIHLAFTDEFAEVTARDFTFRDEDKSYFYDCRLPEVLMQGRANVKWIATTPLNKFVPAPAAFFLRSLDSSQASAAPRIRAIPVEISGWDALDSADDWAQTFGFPVDPWGLTARFPQKVFLNSPFTVCATDTASVTFARVVRRSDEITQQQRNALNW